LLLFTIIKVHSILNILKTSRKHCIKIRYGFQTKLSFEKHSTWSITYTWLYTLYMLYILYIYARMGTVAMATTASPSTRQETIRISSMTMPWRRTRTRTGCVSSATVSMGEMCALTPNRARTFSLSTSRRRGPVAVWTTRPFKLRLLRRLSDWISRTSPYSLYQSFCSLRTFWRRSRPIRCSC